MVVTTAHCFLSRHVEIALLFAFGGVSNKDSDDADKEEDSREEDTNDPLGGTKVRIFCPEKRCPVDPMTSGRFGLLLSVEDCR